MKHICPECGQGKHGNCHGTAWDHEKDVPTNCDCVDRQHDD